jgi:hypothetical protein
MKEMGDEDHYLHRCTNEEMVEARIRFIREAKHSILDFEHFNTSCIIEYCTVMHDDRVYTIFCSFVRDLLNSYKLAKENIGQTLPKITKTRSGRISRKPDKLDL